MGRVPFYAVLILLFAGCASSKMYYGKLRYVEGIGPAKDDFEGFQVVIPGLIDTVDVESDGRFEFKATSEDVRIDHLLILMNGEAGKRRKELSNWAWAGSLEVVMDVSKEKEEIWGPREEGGTGTRRRVVPTGGSN